MGGAPAKLPRGITRYRSRYRVRMNHEGHTHSLGMFDTLTDARAALDIARGEAARAGLSRRLSAGQPATLRQQRLKPSR